MVHKQTNNLRFKMEIPGKLQSAICTVFLLLIIEVLHSNSANISIPEHAHLDTGTPLSEQPLNYSQGISDTWNVKDAQSINESTIAPTVPSSVSTEKLSTFHYTTQMPLEMSSDGSVVSPTYATPPMSLQNKAYEYQPAISEPPTENQVPYSSPENKVPFSSPENKVPYSSPENKVPYLSPENNTSAASNSANHTSLPGENINFKIHSTDEKSSTAVHNNVNTSYNKIISIQQANIAPINIMSRDSDSAVSEIKSNAYQLGSVTKDDQLKSAHNKNFGIFKYDLSDIRLLPSSVQAENSSLSSNGNGTYATPDISITDKTVEAYNGKEQIMLHVEHKQEPLMNSNEPNISQRLDSTASESVSAKQNDTDQKPRNINEPTVEVVTTSSPQPPKISEQPKTPSPTPTDHLTLDLQPTDLNTSQSTTPIPTMPIVSTTEEMQSSNLTSTSSPVINAATRPPSENTVHQFLADLKSHLILCLISLILLLLAGTVVFSFVLAIYLALKYCVLGIVKVCKSMKRCFSHRKCSRSGGFHESGSLFPRCDVSIRPYDPNSQIDRDMY